MDRQLELEIQGEKSYNKIRVFLIFSFSVPVLIGYLTGTIKWEFFLFAMFIYMISFAISMFFLKTNRYNSRLKYVCGLLEISAVYFLTSAISFFRNPSGR